MSLFEFIDYRAYIRAFIEQKPRAGRGELARIADELRISRTMLSQIMSGTRDLTTDQAYELSQYFQFIELETDYLVLLVQIERAATQKHKTYLKKKRNQLKEQALQLSKRVPHQKELGETEKSVFYSSWLYSAVHLFTTLNPEGVSLEQIMERFYLDRSKVMEILQFLQRANLCIEKDGKYTVGVQSTFISRNSPHVLKHHSNWRIRAIHKSEQLTPQEMMFTSQVSISKKDFEVVREKFAQFLKEIEKLVTDSPAEDLANLNIDWFWIGQDR